MLEPSEASSGDAEQHSRAHHRPGAARASDQHHPAVTGSHGGQRQRSVSLNRFKFASVVELNSDLKVRKTKASGNTWNSSLCSQQMWSLASQQIKPSFKDKRKQKKVNSTTFCPFDVVM